MTLARKITRARRLAKLTTMPEDEIHERVVAALRAAGWEGCFFHCPNGGKRDKRTAEKLKRMGVSPGVPDLIIVEPPKGTDRPGAVIEIKKIGGRVSKEQRAWLQRFELSGFVTAVCYGLDACMSTLEEWGYL